MLTLTQIFMSEFIGTAALLALGIGLNSNNALKETNGFKAGWVGACFGWGLAVCFAAFIGYSSGAHLNPAVTLAFALEGQQFAPNVPISWAAGATYVAAQLCGAFVGAIIAFLAYQPYYARHNTPELSISLFATVPNIRSRRWAFVTETIGTMFLVTWLLVSGYTEHALGFLAVGLAIVAIGMGFGGPTGYAINPARDLGPRLAHWLLPIPNKGSSDWSYAWVPLIAPCVGAVLGVIIASAVTP